MAEGIGGLAAHEPSRNGRAGLFGELQTETLTLHVRQGIGILMILVMLPLQVLSGAMTPRGSMPDFVCNLMLAAPDTHFNIMAQVVLFRGASLPVFWPQLLALAAIGAILFVFALRRFRAFLK